jgi:hypothetical protein
MKVFKIYGFQLDCSDQAFDRLRQAGHVFHDGKGWITATSGRIPGGFSPIKKIRAKSLCEAIKIYREELI